MIGATSVSALVFAVVGVLLLAGALWKIGQLTIAPTDPGVRLVAACLSCLTIMFDLHGSVQEFVGTGTDLVLGPASPVLIRNLALLGSAYAAMGLLLYTGDDSARRTVLLQRGHTITCALLLIIGWYSSVPAERFQDEPHPAALGMIVFWATGVLYTGYASGVIAVLLARRARRVEPRTAFGLRMAAMGWWGCVPFLTLPRLPAVLLGARGFTEPAALSTSAELLLRLTVGMMLVGLCIPALATRWAATRLWLTHRSLSQALEPLWLALREVFPEHILIRETGPRVYLWRVHQRFYRRVVECRDGLILLGPFVDPAACSAGPGAEARAPLKERCGPTATIGSPVCPAQ